MWPCGCGGATTTPKKRCWPSPASWPTIAEATVGEARAVAVNARRTLARRGVARVGADAPGAGRLERTAAAVEQIVAQTRARLAGEIPDGATRVVSLARSRRPPHPQRPSRPTGRVRLQSPGGRQRRRDRRRPRVVIGNPPDAPMLAPAIARIKARFGQAPRAVTADRGYGEAKIDADLEALGVKTRGHSPARQTRRRPAPRCNAAAGS